MNVLVTGGAGYIGSHAVRSLARAGHIAIVYDNLTKGHREAVTNSPFVHGDILDSSLLRKTLIGYNIDAVMHFAASSLVGESMANPSSYYHNNLSGTLQLLQAMLECQINKIVFSSTAAIYGNPSDDFISETTAKRPTNVYGRTKWMIEQAMADYSTAYGLRYIALRYFNACGAAADGLIGEDHTPETHLIPLVLQTCLGQREAIQIFGNDYPTPDGTCIRDYIHVDDLATAHCLSIDALAAGATSSAYNLGNGNGFSVRQVIEAAEMVTDQKITKTIAARRPGDPSRLVATSAKIRSELGWQPEHTDIKTIIASAWNWHRLHPNGFSK